MIKLFVTDMDGTLLNSQQELSPENIAAIREAAVAGVTVTVATGRMYPSALPYVKKLGIDVPIITYGGAVIKSVMGEIIYSSFIDENLVRQVLEFYFANDWPIQIYSGDELFYEQETPLTTLYCQKARIKGNAVGRRGMLAHTKKVPKMLSATNTVEEADAYQAAFREKFGSSLSAARSASTFLDITNAGVNKATAISQLASILGISLNEVLAIGDSENDLPMLQVAGIAVAMGNATPAVKEAADYVVADEDHDGVAETIRKYVL